MPSDATVKVEWLVRSVPNAATEFQMQAEDLFDARRIKGAFTHAVVIKRTITEEILND